MELLRRRQRAAGVLIIAVFFAAQTAQSEPAASPSTASASAPAAGSSSSLISEAEKKLCGSTTEYINALKFLRETKEFSFQEEVARKIAGDVSSGCDGAAQRFAQILLLLKTVGVSETRSLQMALEFAKSPPDVQKNFLDIFTHSFLKEFFDFEYSKALQIALELSKGYKGDPRMEREDFINLTHFCKDPSALGLPIRFCADYSVEVAKLSQYFKDGVAKPFREFYKNLREKPGLTLDVKAALELSYGVLKSGPRAPENFTQAFEFATSDLKLDKKNALKFALALAGRSFVGEKPPLQQEAQGDRAPGETVEAGTQQP